jgi:hypothetical protein
MAQVEQRQQGCQTFGSQQVVGVFIPQHFDNVCRFIAATVVTLNISDALDVGFQEDLEHDLPLKSQRLDLTPSISPLYLTDKLLFHRI